MQTIGVIGLLIMLLVASLPVLAVVLVVYFLMKRQSQRRHQELVESLAIQRDAFVESLRTVLDARLPPPAEAKPQREAKISEDKLMVIGAVLACHFGKRVKVRSARRVIVGGGSNVWSQQGRAAVQASHSGFR
ncbi:MAG: hypothetical protein KIT83_17940 [Bryobacterales bacterium]|nr:hypothetical protein [Bryobacterales bacterium]